MKIREQMRKKLQMNGSDGHEKMQSGLPWMQVACVFVRMVSLLGKWGMLEEGGGGGRGGNNGGGEAILESL